MSEMTLHIRPAYRQSADDERGVFCPLHDLVLLDSLRPIGFSQHGQSLYRNPYSQIRRVSQSYGILLLHLTILFFYLIITYFLDCTVQNYLKKAHPRIRPARMRGYNLFNCQKINTPSFGSGSSALRSPSPMQLTRTPVSRDFPRNYYWRTLSAAAQFGHYVPPAMNP